MIAGEQLSLSFVQQLYIWLKGAVLKRDHECSTCRQDSAYFIYIIYHKNQHLVCLC